MIHVVIGLVAVAALLVVMFAWVLFGKPLLYDPYE